MSDIAVHARRRRRAAARRWQPAHIDLLLVVEAPPSALDRYFYFEDVPRHDSLFRHVVEAVLGEKPSRDKAPYLDALRERGVFVVEMSPDPFHDRRAVLPGCVPALISRINELQPDRVLLIGTPVYDRLIAARASRRSVGSGSSAVASHRWPAREEVSTP